MSGYKQNKITDAGNEHEADVSSAKPTAQEINDGFYTTLIQELCNAYHRQYQKHFAAGETEKAMYYRGKAEAMGEAFRHFLELYT